MQRADREHHTVCCMLAKRVLYQVRDGSGVSSSLGWYVIVDTLHKALPESEILFAILCAYDNGSMRTSHSSHVNCLNTVSPSIPPYVVLNLSLFVMVGTNIPISAVQEKYGTLASLLDHVVGLPAGLQVSVRDIPGHHCIAVVGTLQLLAVWLLPLLMVFRCGDRWTL